MEVLEWEIGGLNTYRLALQYSTSMVLRFSDHGIFHQSSLMRHINTQAAARMP